jgi:phytoene synthase
MKADYDYCQALVRERDRERFLSALFAPKEKRSHLFGLYAFDLEIAHVPDAVREPMAGEIRLQWWREAIGGARVEEAAANPVAAVLLDTMARFALSADALTEIVDARSFDLLGQPMGSREALDAYLLASVGRPIELAARVLDSSWPSQDAVRAAARVIGMTGVIRGLPREVAKGRLFLPLDVLAAHEVHTASVLGGENSEGLRNAIAELRTSAEMELARLRAMPIPASVLPAFLPATLAPLYLARTEKSGYDPFQSDISLSGLRSQFALWRAARSGKF